VFMYEGACPESAKFRPWLYAMSQLMPRLAFGRIDVSGPGGPVAATFKVLPHSGSPAIKMFQRDNPEGKRIIDYRGPLEFDAMADWCRAVVAGREHSHSQEGYEPPEHAAAAAASKEASKKGNALDKLPDSVRAMAETMVREQRLQRVLKQRGGGMAEKYENLVSERYQQIVSEEGTNVDEKFASQEANRRARDEVRNQLLSTAPADVREEIEREVHLGKQDAQAASSQGGGEPKPKKKKHKQQKKKGASKEEL